MKKWVVGTVIFASALLTTACGNGSKEQGENTKTPETESKTASIKVESGEYVIPSGKSVTDSSAYLALKVKITNKTKDTMNVSSSDMGLYDADGNKASSESVYDDEDNFKGLDYENLSGKSSKSGYLVYEIDKSKKYSLRFKPSEYSEKKVAEIKIKINPKKYTDNSENYKKATEDYINTVFLGKEASTSKTGIELSNDTKKDTDTFKQNFVKNLKDEFDDYSPSDAELTTLADKYIEANGKKAKIETKVTVMTPSKVEVSIRPETIDLSDVDTEAIYEDFVNKNQGKYDDYDKARQDAEKYMLQQLPGIIEKTNTSLPKYIDGDGYKLHLTKTDKKWQLDTSDASDNYDYEDVVSAFSGGVID